MCRYWKKFMARAKLMHNTKTVQGCYKITKKYWDLNRNETDDTKKRDNDINIIVDDSNKILIDTDVIAESVNDYFCEVGDKLCERFLLDDM